jgi:hypothetical protein
MSLVQPGLFSAGDDTTVLYLLTPYEAIARVVRGRAIG